MVWNDYQVNRHTTVLYAAIIVNDGCTAFTIYISSSFSFPCLSMYNMRTEQPYNEWIHMKCHLPHPFCNGSARVWRSVCMYKLRIHISCAMYSCVCTLYTECHSKQRVERSTTEQSNATVTNSRLIWIWIEMIIFTLKISFVLQWKLRKVFEFR